MSFSLQSSFRRITQTFVRYFQNKAALRLVPPPQGIVSARRINLRADGCDLGEITTPQAFLSAIGRSAETKVSIDSWEAFWHTSGYDLKKAGVAVKDRRQVQGCGLANGHLMFYRYILWCMEKYRQNILVEDFAHGPRPKKKIRGEPGVTFEASKEGLYKGPILGKHVAGPLYRFTFPTGAPSGWTDTAKFAVFSCNKAASM
ncbi:hypothetical protein J3R83DRAFT_12983 [Lanmaoa asiatica]|nr:hypothetical protein J3R83DRAFT_12983 [Lanmaoa asiatica]